VTNVQNMSPPLGESRSADWADSSGATCWRSAKMKVGMVTSWCGGAPLEFELLMMAGSWIAANGAAIHARIT